MGKSKELAELGNVVTQSGGNVGIGVSNPSAPLEITANSGANALRIRARSGDDYGFINYYSNDGSTRWAEIYSSSDKDINFTTDGTGSVKFKVDASGRVTMPYQPAFSAYYSGFGNFTYNAGNIVAEFNATRFNIGNHFNTSTGVFTAPVSGVYAFYFNGYNNSTSYARWLLLKNGSDAFGGQGAISQSGDAICVSGAVYLNASDFVRIEAVYNGQLLYQQSEHTTFSGYLIG